MFQCAQGSKTTVQTCGFATVGKIDFHLGVTVSVIGLAMRNRCTKWRDWMDSGEASMNFGSLLLHYGSGMQWNDHIHICFRAQHFYFVVYFWNYGNSRGVFLARTVFHLINCILHRSVFTLDIPSGFPTSLFPKEIWILSSTCNTILKAIAFFLLFFCLGDHFCRLLLGMGLGTSWVRRCLVLSQKYITIACINTERGTSQPKWKWP